MRRAAAPAADIVMGDQKMGAKQDSSEGATIRVTLFASLGCHGFRSSDAIPPTPSDCAASVGRNFASSAIHQKYQRNVPEGAFQSATGTHSIHSDR
jgi:hypothetical protein